MKRIAILLLFCAALACVHAETIILRTGARVQGTIVFQNEEVVIVRDAAGARFQYPRTDVESVLTDEQQESAEETAAEEPEVNTVKKASVLIEISEGAVFLPGEKLGEFVSFDLLVGSHHIGDRHIFVGGGVGYQGMFMLNDAKDSYHFIPIQAALRMPVIEQKHAPVFGASIGYGIAVKKNYTGGLYAGIDFGYRCQLNPKTAIGAVAFVRFQQAKVNVTETVDGYDFVHKTGRNFISFGAKFTLYF